MPQLAEVETITKLIFNTPSGGDTIKVGATQTYGPVDVDHYDQIRVAVHHRGKAGPSVLLHIRPESTQGSTLIPLSPMIPPLAPGGSDSVIYPVPGEKLTIVVTASGPAGDTATYDLLVYGSR